MQIITERNRRIIQFLDELHFSSVGYAYQIIFAETHNQGFSAEMEMHIYIKLNVIMERDDKWGKLTWILDGYSNLKYTLRDSLTKLD